ncbi:hypothetical protein BGX26_009221, partial [Mortierella sp. AD094]
VQWMAEHWPKLRIIRGLQGGVKFRMKAGSEESGEGEKRNESKEDKEARNENRVMRWLQEHCPRIRVFDNSFGQVLDLDTIN